MYPLNNCTACPGLITTSSIRISTIWRNARKLADGHELQVFGH
jgi:hypothetical protein